MHVRYEYLCSGYCYDHNHVSLQRPDTRCKDSELYVCSGVLTDFLLTQLDVYIGMELSVVPVFQSEIAPTQIRGFMVGTYQLTIVVSTFLDLMKATIGRRNALTANASFQFGGMVIGWVCNGTSKIQDDRAWRIPLGLFFIIPTVISSLIWFIPEVRIYTSQILFTIIMILISRSRRGGF